MLHTNCHALHFTLPSDAKIQKNAVHIGVGYIMCYLGNITVQERYG